jgi:multiple sugar transport system substrate-binding protein
MLILSRSLTESLNHFVACYRGIKYVVVFHQSKSKTKGEQTMSRIAKLLPLLLVATLVFAACAPAPAPAPAAEAPTAAATPAETPATEAEPAETPAAEAEPAETPAAAEEPAPAVASPGDQPVFFSTQFVPVEEQERFRAILQDGGFDVIGSEEGPLIDVVLAGVQAGTSEIDVIGTLHGTFPPLAAQDALANMIDVADDLSDDRELTEAFLQTGLLGTQDFLYYVPWMQATYIMAAHNDALPYLPEGADVNALTWEQLGEWCQNIMQETGEARCGLPHAGLFHRFLQGYLWPSWTGGMVTTFRNDDAAAMLTWVSESLWPYVNPQSINYAFMQEPLLAGEVWVAFDHTARLLEAFNAEPENFIAFPAPAGPYGRSFMPVVVGLGIPANAQNREGAEALIEYLTRPDVQGRILAELGFFPVVAGVDTTDLPEGIAIEAAAVEAQSTADDALPALLPVGLGARGGEINQIFRNAFDRVVLNGEDVQTVLDSEGDNLQTLMDETGAPCWAPDPPSTGPCQVE